MHMIRTGLIGVGRWGSKLARVLREHHATDLIAVCDQNPQRLQDYSDIEVLTSAEMLLDRHDLNAVVIAAPPATHVSLARLALRRGKHVLCEKPIAQSCEECLELQRLSDDMHLCLMVDHTPVYLDEIRHARRRVNWHDVTSVRCERTSLRRPADLLELLWDLAPHDLAVLHCWFGKLPQDWTVQVEGMQRLSLRSQVAGGPQFEVTIGSDSVPTRSIVVDLPGRQLAFHQQQLRPEPLHTVIDTFAHCVRRGGRPPTGIRCALATTCVLERAANILRCAAQRRASPLAPVPNQPQQFETEPSEAARNPSISGE